MWLNYYLQRKKIFFFFNLQWSPHEEWRGKKTNENEIKGMESFSIKPLFLHTLLNSLELLILHKKTDHQRTINWATTICFHSPNILTFFPVTSTINFFITLSKCTLKNHEGITHNCLRVWSISAIHSHFNYSYTGFNINIHTFDYNQKPSGNSVDY